MLYYCSPYYRSNVYSGANKRFEEFILQTIALDINFKIIVLDGNIPPIVTSDKCVLIPSYLAFSRFLLWIWLNFAFIFLEKGVVVNDFKPIPFFAYLKHDAYLLIHDLRKIIGADGEIRGLIGHILICFLKIFPTVITVSKSSKKLLVDYCGLLEKDIIVSYNGVSSLYQESFKHVY